MLGICFFVLCAVSAVYGAASGNLAAVSSGALDGAAAAVRLTFTLSGTMALWSGIMNVLREAGWIERLSRALSPLLRCVFPDAWRTGTACGEITAALSANLLGIGNAATPLALAAMAKLQAENPHPERATDDMITMAVLASSSLDLLPVTLLSMRRAAGAPSPERVIVPVWIVSGVCAAAAVTLCRAAAWAGKERRRR